MVNPKRYTEINSYQNIQSNGQTGTYTKTKIDNLK